MEADPPTAIAHLFDGLEDPRAHRTRRHKLEDILMIALVAILGGAETWTTVELFGRAKQAWFGKFLELPHGIPSHDTFSRVFARLDPEQLNTCFMRWVEHLTAKRGITPKTVAIDGKTLRASGDVPRGEPALHLLSAWAHETGLVLGQLACDGKSNEITAIPELIERLDLKGCTVTVDALNTQKKVARSILDHAEGYVMTLKQNHEKLHTDAVLTFAQADDEPSRFRCDEHTTMSKGHGRVERRCHMTISLDKQTWRLPAAGGEKERWPGLTALGRVVRERTDKATGQTSTQTAYYLLSQPMTAECFAKAVRGHWGIENAAHWVLDVVFDEDRCRSRKDHGDENFALMRRLALNLLRNNRERTKLSMTSQRHKIGWDIDFLDGLLQHAI